MKFEMEIFSSFGLEKEKERHYPSICFLDMLILFKCASTKSIKVLTNRDKYLYVVLITLLGLTTLITLK